MQNMTTETQTHSRRHFDAVVAGRGPAGCLAAAACAEAGLRVALVGPPAEWKQRLCVWLDEVEPHGLTSHLDRRFERASVRTPSAEHVLERAYGRLDNGSLRAHLERIVAARGAVLSSLVEDFSSDGEQTLVKLSGGEQLSCSLLVDASGASGACVSATASTDRPSCPTAFQTAWGIEVRARVPAERFDAERMLLMDWSSPSDSPSPSPSGSAVCERDPAVPSFLYAMHLGADRWFFEETVLVARPAVTMDVLRRRLASRLQGLGVELLGAPIDVERCAIPMDVPVPDLDRGAVPFGAAAAFIHPATGYSVAFAADRAVALAGALAESIRVGASSREAAGAAWQAIWPQQALRVHALHRFGAEALMAMEPGLVPGFFGSFFDLPADVSSGWLSRRLSAGATAAAMFRLFRAAAPPVRRALARAAWSARRQLLATLIRPRAATQAGSRLLISNPELVRSHP